VVGSERVTPSMHRLTVGGDGLSGFETTGIPDERIKVVFHPDGEAPALPWWDDAGIHYPPGARVPVTRTYTVRRFDPDSTTLTIDFALHEGGAAATWASAAGPGDPVGIVGPGGSPAIRDWPGDALLLGDKAALPALAAIVEQRPAGTKVDAYVLVEDDDERQPLTSAADLAVTWLHETSASAGLLEPLVARGSLEGVFVWAAGEASQMRAVRRHLRDEVGLERDRFSVAGYWRRRLTEDEAIAEHLTATAAAAARGAGEAEIEDAGVY